MRTVGVSIAMTFAFGYPYVSFAQGQQRPLSPAAASLMDAMGKGNVGMYGDTALVDDQGRILGIAKAARQSGTVDWTVLNPRTAPKLPCAAAGQCTDLATLPTVADWARGKGVTKHSFAARDASCPKPLCTVVTAPCTDWHRQGQECVVSRTCVDQPCTPPPPPAPSPSSSRLKMMTPAPGAPVR